MKPLPLAVLLLALVAATAQGQVKPGQVQPDRIAFGQVHVGATAEASFLVYAEAAADGGVTFEVTAPPFVKVLRKDPDVWALPGRKFQTGAVEFALDTTQAGELTGEITVRLNATSVRVPVTASVKPRRADLLRLLVVETPFQKYSTSDGGHFRPWTDLVAAASWDVSYLLAPRDQPVLRDLRLSDYGAILLGPEGVFWLKDADVKRLRAYLEDGGTVLVTANHFFQGTVARANTLLTPYGLSMADTEAQGPNNQVTVEKAGLDPRLVKAGIETLTFHRASPSTVTNPLLARVLVKAAQVGQADDGFVAAANAGNGKVVAIGQSLWWDWVSSRRDPSGGNARLLRWVLDSAHQRRQRFLGLRQPLSAAQRATCWAGLASDDLDEASEARHWLTRAPAADRDTVPFLRGRLRPDPPPDADRLRRLIAQLDDEAFPAREQAQRELEDLGDPALAALRKALEAKPSPEVRRRIEGILNKPRPLSPEKRRQVRAIDVLEQLATPDAKVLLRDISKGAPGTPATVAAQAALDRLAPAPGPTPERRP